MFTEQSTSHNEARKNYEEALKELKKDKITQHKITQCNTSLLPLLLTIENYRIFHINVEYAFYAVLSEYKLLGILPHFPSLTLLSQYIKPLKIKKSIAENQCISASTLQKRFKDFTKNNSRSAESSPVIKCESTPNNRIIIKEFKEILIQDTDMEEHHTEDNQKKIYKDKEFEINFIKKTMIFESVEFGLIINDLIYNTKIVNKKSKKHNFILSFFNENSFFQSEVFVKEFNENQKFFSIILFSFYCKTPLYPIEIALLMGFNNKIREIKNEVQLHKIVEILEEMVKTNLIVFDEVSKTFTPTKNGLIAFNTHSGQIKEQAVNHLSEIGQQNIDKTPILRLNRQVLESSSSVEEKLSSSQPEEQKTSHPFLDNCITPKFPHVYQLNSMLAVTALICEYHLKNQLDEFPSSRIIAPYIKPVMKNDRNNSKREALEASSIPKKLTNLSKFKVIKFLSMQKKPTKINEINMDSNINLSQNENLYISLQEIYSAVLLGLVLENNLTQPYTLDEKKQDFIKFLKDFLQTQEQKEPSLAQIVELLCFQACRFEISLNILEIAILIMHFYQENKDIRKYRDDYSNAFLLAIKEHMNSNRQLTQQTIPTTPAKTSEKDSEPQRIIAAEALLNLTGGVVPTPAPYSVAQISTNSISFFGITPNSSLTTNLTSHLENDLSIKK